MASVWIRTRTTKDGSKRYRVEYRFGGRESRIRYGGSFATKREATIRAGWIAGELAAQRVPDLGVPAERAAERTLREAARRWQESRVDVAENTRLQHRSAVRLLLPLLGDRRVDTITPTDVADLVATLTVKGKARETVRKSLAALAMILAHASVTPNPARDKVKVRLPRQERPEIVPPTAAHVLAVHGLLPTRYRLPLLVLDATGMRLGELELLTWGDLDEPRQRWRVSRAASKTGRARWVSVPPVIFDAVCALVPRDDRISERRIFQGFGGDRFRTAGHPRLYRRRHPCFLATRPAAPPDFASSPRGHPVGSHRRARRATEPRGHGQYLHPRPHRRGRARLRGSARTRLAVMGQAQPARRRRRLFVARPLRNR
jgi:integrase